MGAHILVDPIWDTLHECNRFSLVVRRCFVQRNTKDNCDKEPKPYLFLPKNNDRVLPNAFSHILDIRHVQVETGVHTIVRLPGKVVSDCTLSSCRRLLFVCRTERSKSAVSSELFCLRKDTNQAATRNQNTKTQTKTKPNPTKKEQGSYLRLAA